MAIDPGKLRVELLVHRHDERVGEEKVAVPPPVANLSDERMAIVKTTHTDESHDQTRR